MGCTWNWHIVHRSSVNFLEKERHARRGASNRLLLVKTRTLTSPSIVSPGLLNERKKSHFVFVDIASISGGVDAFRKFRQDHSHARRHRCLPRTAFSLLRLFRPSTFFTLSISPPRPPASPPPPLACAILGRLARYRDVDFTGELLHNACMFVSNGPFTIHFDACVEECVLQTRNGMSEHNTK